MVFSLVLSGLVSNLRGEVEERMLRDLATPPNERHQTMRKENSLMARATREWAMRPATPQRCECGWVCATGCALSTDATWARQRWPSISFGNVEIDTHARVVRRRAERKAWSQGPKVWRGAEH